MCSKLAHKAYEPPWKTVEVESLEDWWGLFALKASSHGVPLELKSGVVILDGKMSLILSSSPLLLSPVVVEKENGDWVWSRSRKKAFDVHKPTQGAPASCKTNNNFVGLCNIQWKSDQLTANRGMPVFG